MSRKDMALDKVSLSLAPWKAESQWNSRDVARFCLSLTVGSTAPWRAFWQYK
jgi:nuclear transport factor 2 (NTF2) superfamily protein